MAAIGNAVRWSWRAARTTFRSCRPSLRPAGVASHLTAKDYRNPRQLDARGVLIVGASATGLQLADEIPRSGREVTLAVGEHIRMPRTYRGRDIQWWLDAAGILDERHDEVEDIGVPVHSVPAARGDAGARDTGSECVDRARRRARRAPGGRERRQAAILRIAAQSLRHGGPQANASARPDR